MGKLAWPVKQAQEDFEIEVVKDTDGQDVIYLFLPMPEGTQQLRFDDALRLWNALTDTLEWLLPVSQEVIDETIKQDQKIIESLVAMLEHHFNYCLSDGDPDTTDRRHIFTNGKYELTVIEDQGRIQGFYCEKG